MTGQPQLRGNAGRTRRLWAAYDVNLARLPVFSSSQARAEPRVDQIPLVAGHLYDRPVVVAAGRASNRDAFLLFTFAARFHDLGCPSENRVDFSLAEAARLLGSVAVGGSQRRLVRRSLLRLQTLSIQCLLRTVEHGEVAFTGGFVDHSVVTSRGRGRGWIQFSALFADWLRDSWKSSVDPGLSLLLITADEYAWRLWLFLECERIGTEFTYGVFETGGWVPAIADLLRMGDHVRSRALRRLKAALLTIERADPAYRFELTADRVGQHWLKVRRDRRLRAAVTRNKQGMGGQARGQPRSREKGTRGQAVHAQYGEPHRGPIHRPSLARSSLVLGQGWEPVSAVLRSIFPEADQDNIHGLCRDTGASPRLGGD